MRVKRVGSIITSIVCVSSVALGGVVMVPSAVAQDYSGSTSSNNTPLTQYVPVNLSDFGYDKVYSKEAVDKKLKEYEGIYKVLWNGEDIKTSYIDTNAEKQYEVIRQEKSDYNVKPFIDLLKRGVIEGEGKTSDYLTKFKVDDKFVNNENTKVATQFALALILSYQASGFNKGGNYKEHRLSRQYDVSGGFTDYEDKNHTDVTFVPMYVLKSLDVNKDDYKAGVMPEDLIVNILQNSDPDAKIKWKDLDDRRNFSKSKFISAYWQQAAWLTAIELNPNLINNEIGNFNVNLTGNEADKRAQNIQGWKDNMAKGTEPSLINTHFEKQKSGNYVFNTKGEKLISDIDSLVKDPKASDQARATLENTKGVMNNFLKVINQENSDLKELGLIGSSEVESTTGDDKTTSATQTDEVEPTAGADKTTSSEPTTSDSEPTTSATQTDEVEPTTGADKTTSSEPTTEEETVSSEPTTEEETVSSEPTTEEETEDVEDDNSQSDVNTIDYGDLLDFDETDKEALATIGSVWRSETNAGWLLRNRISNKIDTIAATSKIGDTIEILSFVTILRENGKMVAKATDDSSEASWVVVRFSGYDTPLLLSYNSVLMGEFVS